MHRLSDRYQCAFVTGSSAGLGRALTEMLLEQGIEVVGMSRQPQCPSLGSQYHPWPFDLSKNNELPEQIDAVFAKFPQIDLVINNAGFGILSRLEDLEADAIQRQYAVMLEAPTLIANRAIRHFKTQQGGCLLNISSMAVEIPIPLMPIYNTCKAGLSALSDSLILDASGDGHNYCVIDVRPGDYRTKFADNMQGRAHWNGVDLRAVLDHHHQSAPEVHSALTAIQKALLAGKNRRLRVGTFIQTVMGCLGARGLPSSVVRMIIRNYYKH